MSQPNQLVSPSTKSQSEYQNSEQSLGTSISSSDKYDDDNGIEPRVKIKRWSDAILETIGISNSITCAAASDRFLVIGTQSGTVHQMDLDGNQVKLFNSHTRTIAQVCIDSSGEYIASASHDGIWCIIIGNVIITSLYTPEIQKVKFKNPITSVSFEPDYVIKASRQFVAGGLTGNLTLNSKGWFSLAQTVIHTDQNPISSLYWHGSYIIWSTAEKVFVYDVSSSQLIGSIERIDTSFRADLIRCNICWKSASSFFFGWGNEFKFVEIKVI